MYFSRIAAIIALPLFFNAYVYADQDKSSKSAGEKPKEVFAFTVKKQKVVSKLLYPTLLKSVVTSELKANTQGIISEIFVELGQRVKKGQKLFSVKNPDPAFQFNDNIHFAPVEASVSQVFVQRGNHVGAGEKIMVISRPEELYAQIRVPVKESSKISLGQQGLLKVEQLGKDFPISLKTLAQSADPLTGTVLAELSIVKSAENNNELIPGLMGMVELNTQEREAFLVPEKAVVYVGQDTFVRKIENLKATKVKIKTGEARAGKVEVLEGLSEEDLIIERASGHIKDGDPVKVVEEKA